MIMSILKNLQKELTVFLITFFVATIIYVFAQSWWETAKQLKRDAEYDLSEAKQRYYTAIDQKRLLKEFETRFKQLKEEGIVGKENRLNWVDNIEKITQVYQIPYLKYRIDKRQPFSTVNLTQKYPGIDVFKSEMVLEMQLLHEGDIYTVINKLEQNALGLFDVRQCKISRNQLQSESLLDSKTDKNFAAVCKLNWYTIEEKAIQREDGGSS